MPSIAKYHGKKGISYRVRVHVGGQKYLTKTFKKLKSARDWSRKVESDFKDGLLEISTKSSIYTLSEAIRKYKQEVLPSITRSEAYIKMSISYLNYWNKRIGDYPFSAVSSAIIASCRDELGIRKRKTLSAGTINRYLSHLSGLFNYAINDLGWTKENPVSSVKKFKEPEGRIRMLSEDELKKLLYAARFERVKPMLLIVVLAISTGARKSEILHITRNNVHIRKGYIVINKTKGSITRTLYVSGYCLELLRVHMRRTSKNHKYIFSSKRHDKSYEIDKEWKRILQRCQIKDLRFHDLRHTCASYLAMEGSSVAEIAEVLGHKSLKMVKRYAHLTEKHTQAVAGRMQRNIFHQFQRYMPGKK